MRLDKCFASFSSLTSLRFIRGLLGNSCRSLCERPSGLIRTRASFALGKSIRYTLPHAARRSPFRGVSSPCQAAHKIPSAAASYPEFPFWLPVTDQYTPVCLPSSPFWCSVACPPPRLTKERVVPARPKEPKTGKPPLSFAFREHLSRHLRVHRLSCFHRQPPTPRASAEPQSAAPCFQPGFPFSAPVQE